MTYLVRRTCTEIGGDDPRDESEHSSRPLEDFRDTAAYVLLGAPGAGKTTAFEQEAADCPDGHPVTARDFVTFHDKPAWHGATLFIDGLDEARAGAADGRTQFDRIRRKLDALGQPRFRLSCREAHWFGANDRSHLETVSPGGKVKVLRLDPLSEDDVREILRRHPDIEDADAFIAAARDRGIDGLLANPQSMEMLADAVAGGDRPETRMKTFELACRKLVREPNVEHRIATLDGNDVSGLMDVAGRLCAIQLLTGSAGYALLPDATDVRDFPGLERIPGDDRRLLRVVLDTKLFAAPPGDPGQGRAAPVHRYIAEFMAAGYLAARIDDGLPIGRILSLITGHDGRVVSLLQGLSAWLAARSKASRAELIARDPLGTVLHGDVREFSTEEKCRLLDAVDKEAANYPWIAATLPPDVRLGDLVTPDMTEPLRRLLTDSARDRARQPFAYILLAILRRGPAVPDVANDVMAIVRNGDCHPSVRQAALDTFAGWTRNDESSDTGLDALLADIATGSVSDPNDDLLGTLLSELFPAKLSVSEILPHLRTPRKTPPIGRFSAFWRRTVPQESTHAQLAELLDMIADDFDRLRSVFVGAPGVISPLRRVPTLLLGRKLENPHTELSANRLFNWLGVVSHPELRATRPETETIRDRLRRDAHLLGQLIEQAVAHCSSSSKFARCMHGLERRFLQVPWPPHRCLEQAASAADRRVAEFFVNKVAGDVHRNAHDAALSRHDVEARLAENPALLSAFNRRLAVLEDNDSHENHLLSQHDIDRRERRREWRESLAPHLPALRENRCRPSLLHHLAEAYFGEFVDVGGESPMDRLRELLGDEHLVQAALAGLRQSVRRSDLPSDTEIMRLGAEKQFHVLALPFMAGLEEAVETAPGASITIDEEQVRLGLAINFADPTFSSISPAPGWLPSVLEVHPSIVADVLIRCARPLMRAGRDLQLVFYDLAWSAEYMVVARLASVPLLQAFPTRCTQRQLEGLSFLLQAALLHGDDAPILQLVRRKLAHRSMNVSQRVYWLAAGLLASPNTYQKELESYVFGSERRVRHLAEFLAVRHFPTPLVEQLDPRALQLMMRLLGTSYRPRRPPSGKAYRIDHDMQVSDSIEGFIDGLGSSPSPTATEAIEALSSDDTLRPWRAHLVHATYRQNALRREACFQHRDFGQVLEVLENRRPANAADLAALTMAYLREIARTIRDGNTSDWRQYWNVDSRNRPQEPKPEDACRDALLSDLQARLAGLHVDAQPEGHYADDKRSDIRVYHGGFNVPVEIKKSSHRDLWSAVKTQLIAKYTRDPGAAGYGIYVVFWFGAGKCQPPESGTSPKHPAELETRLRDTLSADEARLISICVADVSAPR